MAKLKLRNESGGLPAAVKGGDLGVTADAAALKARLEAINVEVFQIYQELHDKLIVNKQETVKFWWFYGKKFKYVVERYTERNAGVLADALELDRTAMREALRLVDVWPTIDDIGNLMARTNQRGQPLTWGHVRRLISSALNKTRTPKNGAPKTLRDILIDRALAESWTVADLDAALRRQLGNQKPNAGPKLAQPRDFGRALTNWENENRLWKMRAEQIYMTETIDRLLDEYPAEAVTTTLLTDLDKVDQQLASHEAIAREGRAKIQILRAGIARRLEERGEFDVEHEQANGVRH